MKILYASILFGLIFSTVSTSWAAIADDGRALEAAENATIVTSDKLTFDYKKYFALFENNVIVNDPRLQLKTDRLTILFSENGKAQQVRAEGNVFLTQEDKKARADVATYDLETGKIVLVGGPPQVMQGRNIMEGEVITFWRDEQRVECRPKARLVIYSEDFNSGSDGFFAPTGSGSGSSGGKGGK